MPVSEVYNTDCNKYMPWFAHWFFNLTVSDPPYFAGPNNRRYYGNKISPINVKRKDYDIIQQWDLPDAEWFEVLKFISEYIIIWGANYYDFIGPVHATPRYNELDEWLKVHPRGWIVWDKCNRKSSFNDFELAWTNFDMPTIVFPFMWNGMNQGKSIMEGHIMQGNKRLNEKKIHCTQKPVLLYKWLFNYFAKQGWKIFDTHLGSGSSRIAADDLGFDFYACELDAVIYQKQEKRFNLYTSQKKIIYGNVIN